MRFGTFHEYAAPPWTNPHDVVQQQFEQMLAAEAAGFHELWLAEHNARRYGMGGNCVTTAASAAAATKRIRIATAITRLPLHNPLHLAEDLAYVDVLSKGRLDWGIGKGYDPLEFGSYGVPIEERDQRWEECYRAVRQMWRTGRTEFSGEIYKHADGELQPTPLQRPELPTWMMVSGSEPTIVWAAEQGIPIVIGSGPPWDDIRSRLEMYGEVATRAGHSPELVQHNLANTWQLRLVHVATTRERAIAEFRAGCMWYMEALANRAMFGFAREHQPYEYYVEHKGLVLGSPDDVGEELERYAEKTGVNNLVCWFNIGGQPHAQVLSAIQRFGEEIVPRLKGVGYAWGAHRPWVVAS
jgi:alkanesulfonate monooxygenase SsuD/methylene tetrahydromethanopterin reductase-like flavin-dependent oxidoreductase (luciferase family)